VTETLLLLGRGQRPLANVTAYRYPSPITHRSSDHNTLYSEPIFSPSPFHRVCSCAVRPQHAAATTSLPCVHHTYVVAQHHTSTNARAAGPPAPTHDPSRAARRPTQRPPPGHFYVGGLAALGPPPSPPPPHRQVTSPSASLGRLRLAHSGRHLRTTLWAPLRVA
jgi:hypothetical protein